MDQNQGLAERWRHDHCSLYQCTERRGLTALGCPGGAGRGLIVASGLLKTPRTRWTHSIGARHRLWDQWWRHNKFMMMFMVESVSW